MQQQQAQRLIVQMVAQEVQVHLLQFPELVLPMQVVVVAGRILPVEPVELVVQAVEEMAAIMLLLPLTLWQEPLILVVVVVGRVEETQ